MGLILMIVLGVVGYATFMYWFCKDLSTKVDAFINAVRPEEELL